MVFRTSKAFVKLRIFTIATFLIIALIGVAETSLEEEHFMLSKSIPYRINTHEALYREFTNVVTEKSEINDTTIVPSIMQSVVIESKRSPSDFFRNLLWIDFYETPFTTINYLVQSFQEVSDVLTQVTGFYKEVTSANVSHIPHYQTIIILPLKTTSKIIITKLDIETKILSKINPVAIRFLVLESSIYMVFTRKEEKDSISTSATDLSIWELYSIKNKTFLNELDEKTFTVANGKLTMKSKFIQRQDWEGAQVTCAAFAYSLNDKNEIQGISKFEAGIERQTNGKYELKGGLSASIMSDFQMALNFTRNILPPFDYNANTNYEDQFEVTSGFFDISVSHFGLNPSRVKRMSPLSPTYFDGTVAYFVQPPAHAFRNIYTNSFAPSMWGMLVVNWIAILFSFKLISFMRKAIQNPSDNNSSHYWNNSETVDEVKEKEVDEQVTQEVFWWAIAATCQQGWYMTPATTPCRSVFFSGLLFSFLCYAAYTATIVSELWKNVVPIKNLDGLLKNSDYIYLQKDSDVGKLVFDGVLKDFAKKQASIQMVDAETAYKKVAFSHPGKSCAIDWPEYFVEVNKNDYEEKLKRFGGGGNIDEENEKENAEVHFCKRIKSFRFDYLLPQASMFVPKKSPFRKIWNFRIFVGIERGLFRRYWKEYLKNTRVRCLEEANTTYALGIYDTWIVFAILLSGYTLSLSILTVEIIYKKKAIIRAIQKLK